jgi:hypothetical protein
MIEGMAKKTEAITETSTWGDRISVLYRNRQRFCFPTSLCHVELHWTIDTRHTVHVSPPYH